MKRHSWQTDKASEPEPPGISCSCDACGALRGEYGSDPVLLRMLSKKLLVKGWAGNYLPVEQAYRLAHAVSSVPAEVRRERARQRWAARRPREVA